MSERVREFNPQTAELLLDLPICPSDNRLYRSVKFGIHPSTEYADWLQRCEGWLREALTGWEPDREMWWEVAIDVHLGTAGGDGPNRQKAVLDLLAGAYVAQEGDLGADGFPVKAGTLQRRGGLFDDDRRVERLQVTLRTINTLIPFLRVDARPVESPKDERVERAEALAEAREREQARKQAERERAAAEKARERERARAEKQAAREAAKVAKAAEKARKAAECKRVPSRRGKAASDG